MKRLQAILLINGLGLTILILFLFILKQPQYDFTRDLKIHNHRKVSIDRKSLKENLALCCDERLLNMFLAGQEILGWNRLLEESGSHVVKETAARERHV